MNGRENGKLSVKRKIIDKNQLILKERFALLFSSNMMKINAGINGLEVCKSEWIEREKEMEREKNGRKYNKNVRIF